MKCPSCKYVLADSNDVCLNCQTDLREYKQKHNLIVSSPEVSYSDLLKSLPRSVSSSPLEAVPIETAASPEIPSAPAVETVADSPPPPKPSLPYEELAFRRSRPGHALQDELFSEAFTELGETPWNLEVSRSILVNPQSKEHLELLWSIAQDGLYNPEIDAQLETKVTVSEGSEIKSVELESQVKRIEQRLSTSLLNLRFLRNRSKSGSDSTDPNAKPKNLIEPHLPAPFGKRMAATLVDAVIALSMGLTSTGVYFGLIEPNYLTPLIEDEIPITSLMGSSIIVAFFGIFLALSLLAAIIYLPVSFALLKRTLGMRLVGLLGASAENCLVSREQGLRRGLVIPLSIISAGFIPGLFGRPCLHDWATQTHVCLEPPGWKRRKLE